MQGYMQVSKVANLLDIKKDVVYELIRNGKLQAINIGIRQTRVSRESFLQFCQDSKVDPLDYDV